MLSSAMYTTIKTLWERYKNKTKIARITGHDWKTVDKVIKKIESGKEFPVKKPHPRILDSYKDKIILWLEQDLSGVRIFEELKELGVNIGYSTVKNYTAQIKKREKIFIRIHTLPGEEAQIDFGYVGLTSDSKGKKREKLGCLICG